MYIYKKVLKKFVQKSVRIWNTIGFMWPKFAGVVSVFFLRKTNTFIKSKYSKNRQWSKSIVYFGLWFGVISAFTLTYYNYRFLFAFSYIWWLPAIVATLAVLAKSRQNLKFVNGGFVRVFFW